ncbi:tyrosine-type recombinase/integrase [Bacillus aquiflavi]|uniref:tyrosine-type recombinase/integrase n=1 Tax=Bacillus aquiflavi TaxID=2672567 RepID=UPI00292F265D|nr:tyrosine-type recombinase/integrase [Bacillus aquiflavi]
MGINTGLRVNEMLKMKISDVMNDNGEIKEMFVLTDEQKEKVKLFYLNEKVKEALRLYFSQIHINLRNEHLFKSKKDPFQSISRQQAYRIVNSAARQIGLVENIGTHTL